MTYYKFKHHMGDGLKDYLEGDAEGEPARRPRMDGKLHRINASRGPHNSLYDTPPEQSPKAHGARKKETKQHPLIPIHNSENDKKPT